MKIRIAAILVAATSWVTGQVSSGEALVKAQENLAEAKAEHDALQQAIATMEVPLVEEVEGLEQQLREKEQELKTLEAKEDSLDESQRRLDSELASRKGEFAYTTETIDGYSKGLLNRLQAAEVQLYKDDVERLRNAATEEDNLAEEIVLRLEGLKLGARRLQEAAGGRRFDGQGLVGSDYVNGEFAVLGPVGYFAAKGKEIGGLTGLVQEKTPAIAVFEDEKGPLVKQFVEAGSGVLPIDATGGKALKAVQETPTLADRMADGGYVGYAIIGLGCVAILIALFKLLEINLFRIPTRRTINEILDDLLAGDREKAMAKAKDLQGFTGVMVQAGVENFHERRRILEDALLEKLSAIQPRLERFLPFLALVAAAAPMMGLLGTVLGIMQTFDAMAIYGTGNAQNFSKGIGAALVTTAQGLVVAIPVIVIHGMLKSLARGRFDKAQGVALAILNGTTELDSETKEELADDSSGGDDGDDFDEKELAPV
ncbi:MAG: MotA/TolQ/ExbB proton channel family protein [Verrucomicrobiota bacterium JB023]|nr:MotA/TolQ/ExbB proton channel family protein [Verrucomicrobiota bacterium JB023]